VEQVVKTLGMVNCTPEFAAMPKVVDGFAELFVELLVIVAQYAKPGGKH
jgi:hypothetical protein